MWVSKLKYMHHRQSTFHCSTVVCTHFASMRMCTTKWGARALQPFVLCFSNHTYRVLFLAIEAPPGKAPCFAQLYVVDSHATAKTVTVMCFGDRVKAETVEAWMSGSSGEPLLQYSHCLTNFIWCLWMKIKKVLSLMHLRLTWSFMVDRVRKHGATTSRGGQRSQSSSRTIKTPIHGTSWSAGMEVVSSQGCSVFEFRSRAFYFKFLNLFFT
jgi:hypothetical protein